MHRSETAPLQVDGLSIDPPLVLAPMAGLTDRTFRRLVRRCGGVGLVVSEIVSSEGLTRGAALARNLIRLGADEHPIALQISGGDPVRMADAARICEGAGADLVDINLGCPARKVARSCAGAGLARDVDRARRVARSVVEATRLPVTAKIRLGWSPDALNYLELGGALQEAGIRAITLHARTRDQGYSGTADWTHVARLKESLRIPVVGNGDVSGPEEASRRMAETRCDGIMVGRASLKNPWIFRQIADYLSSGSYREPTPRERLALIEDHLEEISREPIKAALHRMKTFLGIYTRGIPGAASFRVTLEDHRDPEALRRTFEAWASLHFQNTA